MHGRSSSTRLRRGLVQPRRPDGDARAGRCGAAASRAGDRARRRTMPTRSSTSRRSSSTPAISPRRGAGGSAISSSTASSEWARTAARGMQFVDLQTAQTRPAEMTDFLFDGPEDARVTVLLAHGAGAPMDSRLDDRDGAGARRGGAARRALRVRLHGRPPHRRGAQAAAAGRDADPGIPGGGRRARRAGPLVIGGKSMGGRVASMVADELHATGRIAGLLCLGYPFHPPGRPEQLRTAPSRGAARRRR